MTATIRTPVLVFGRENDEVLVAATVKDALTHSTVHAGAGNSLDDFEFFDFEGRPLLPAPGAGLELVEPWQYLERRTRLLLARVWADASPTERAGHEDLVEGFLGGRLDFTTVAARMAAQPTPKHKRGFLHDLCHRTHLC